METPNSNDFIKKTFEPFTLILIMGQGINMETTQYVISSNLKIHNIQEKIRKKSKMGNDRPIYLYFSDTFLISPNESIYDLFLRHGKNEVKEDLNSQKTPKRELTLKAFATAVYG